MSARATYKTVPERYSAASGLREKPIAICWESAHGAFEAEQRLTFVRPRYRSRMRNAMMRAGLMRDFLVDLAVVIMKARARGKAHYVPDLARILALTAVCTIGIWSPRHL